MRNRLLIAVVVTAATFQPATAHAEGSRCPPKEPWSQRGTSIQPYLDAGMPGDSFCLEAGTYHPGAKIHPRQGQSLYGVPGLTVIDGTGLAAVFNGSAGRPSDVTNVGLYDLVVQNAGSIDVRTNSGWIVDGVIAQSSGAYGIVVRGTAPVIRDSIARDNRRFGISGGWSVDALIEGNEITNNNTGLNPPGYSGATHFTNTVGMQVIDNTVHDNFGRGIWFDIDSSDALIQGNVVYDQIDYPYPTRAYPIGDGIRLEISCRITVRDNRVYDNQGPQIAVDGADDNLVEANAVSAALTQPAIRVAPQDNRTEEPLGGWKNCDPALRTAVNNTVRGNDIAHLDAVTYSGILQKKSTSTTTGTTFDGDTFHVPDCGARLWRWWSGTASIKVDFVTLQTLFGQELTGSCVEP